MAKRNKPLVCKYCKKKFYYTKGGTKPNGRLMKHKWKAHRAAMNKIIAKRKKPKPKVTKLDKEFMAIDDILLSDLIGRRGYSTTSYDSVHEQLGGLIIEALLPIAVESIARAIKKKRTK
jgi:hypothetical protein